MRFRGSIGGDTDIAADLFSGEWDRAHIWALKWMAEKDIGNSRCKLNEGGSSPRLVSWRMGYGLDCFRPNEPHSDRPASIYRDVCEHLTQG